MSGENPVAAPGEAGIPGAGEVGTAAIKKLHGFPLRISNEILAMSFKSAVIVFLGSNCDRDIAVTLEAVTGVKPAMIWHRDTELPAVDLIVLPGGFSYGDYLRSGAMAAH